ncbi:hypothetical protein [Streptomyces sp. NPDC054838]
MLLGLDTTDGRPLHWQAGGDSARHRIGPGLLGWPAVRRGTHSVPEGRAENGKEMEIPAGERFVWLSRTAKPAAVHAGDTRTGGDTVVCAVDDHCAVGAGAG